MSYVLSTNDKIVRATAKIALFVLPRVIGGIFFDLSKHHLLAGLLVIAGVLLQALVPPRGKFLLLMLVLSVGFTVVYSLF